MKFLKFARLFLHLSPDQRFRLPSWMVFASCLMDGWYYEEQNPFVRQKTLTKRFREFYIEGGRGSAKSSFQAARLLFHPSVELAGGRAYLISTSLEQTEPTFEFVKRFIDNDPYLKLRFPFHYGGKKPKEYYDHKYDGGLICRKPAPKSGKGAFGMNISFLCVDEPHTIDDREFVEAYETSFKQCENPQSLYTTNSGSSYDSLCGEKHNQGRQVLAGKETADRNGYLVFSIDEDDKRALYEPGTRCGQPSPCLPRPVAPGCASLHTENRTTNRSSWCTATEDSHTA